MPEAKPAKYWAFISYSSKDRRWGEWLRKRLESYPVPKDLRGHRFEDGAVLGKNLQPVFRDRDELPGANNLGEKIHAALRDSRYLVVLCSPRSAQSQWVNKEITEFQAMGKEKNILALILAGEPNSGDPRTECFPKALRLPREPIAGDLRKEGDGKDRGFLKILAGIAQLDFDQIYRRHERAARRSRIGWGIAALSLVLLFAGIAGVAWWQREEATHQRDIAQIQAGKGYLLRAEIHPLSSDAVFYAGRAVGFEGLGKPAGSEEAFPNLFAGAGAAKESAKAYQMIDATAATPFLWSTSGTSVAFSPDGQTLASGSNDTTVKLWDVATGKEKAILSAHIAEVQSLAFSPDGHTLASGSRVRHLISPGEVKLWDVATGMEKATFSGHTGDVTSVAFSPDSQMVASASSDKTVKLWEVATGKEKATLSGHSDSVRSVAFSPDGQMLASGSNDKTLKLWEVASGKEKATLRGDTGEVLGVAFSPDGQTLASGSDDTRVKLWNVMTGKEKTTLSGHSGPVLSVAFSPDGQTLASGASDKSVKLWELSSGKERATLSGHTRGIASVVFSPDGQTLASGSQGDTVKLWDVTTGKEKTTLSGHSDPVLCVAFSPDGQTLASGSKGPAKWGMSPGEVKLWEVATGKGRQPSPATQGMLRAWPSARTDKRWRAGRMTTR